MSILDDDHFYEKSLKPRFKLAIFFIGIVAPMIFTFLIYLNIFQGKIESHEILEFQVWNYSHFIPLALLIFSFLIFQILFFLPVAWVKFSSTSKVTIRIFQISHLALLVLLLFFTTQGKVFLRPSGGWTAYPALSILSQLETMDQVTDFKYACIFIFVLGLLSLFTLTFLHNANLK